MSLANDELDESQITSLDLPMDFKVNWIFRPLKEIVFIHKRGQKWVTRSVESWNYVHHFPHQSSFSSCHQLLPFARKNFSAYRRARNLEIYGRMEFNKFSWLVRSNLISICSFFRTKRRTAVKTRPSIALHHLFIKAAKISFLCLRQQKYKRQNFTSVFVSLIHFCV